MKLGILILLLGVGVVVAALVLRKRLQARKSGASLDDPGQAAIAKAKADIQEFGWHLLRIGSQGRPGFLYTIGLWESYKHPEILLFAASEDPRGMTNRLAALAKRVAAGESLKSGEILSKAFGNHDGAVRDVHPRWFPAFLGTAGAVYGDFRFPAVQLYWPDKAGRFPWQSGFTTELFPFQSVLYQDNLILANVGFDMVQWIVNLEGPKALEASLDDLAVSPGAVAERGSMIDDWRWRIGPDAELLQVTIFGDLFLKTPDGHVHWLDTGSDLYEDIADDHESWLRAVCNHPSLFFHASTLLHARSLQYLPEAGGVYSWIKPPMFGGEDTVGNLGLVSALVHVSHEGRMAQSVPAGEAPSQALGLDL